MSDFRMYTTNRTFTAPPKLVVDTAAYGVSDGETITYCTFIGGEGSEALKLSRNVTKADISTSSFSGGLEDCIDILGADHVTFTNCMFIRANAARDCTIKGGASYIKFIK